MKNLILQIEKETGVTNLDKMSWHDIIDNVILPKMAGLVQNRWAISDIFMHFVANNAYDIYLIDKQKASILYEIALQRLSCGAVLHESTTWLETLPKKYWDYSSKWDETHVMTSGCYNFILKAMEMCLKDEETKDHAQKILFGLLKHISPNGEVSHCYYHLADFKPKATELYFHAERLVEEYVSFEELYRNYAQPAQWQKHKLWFSQHYEKLDWKKFFVDTACLSGNFIQRIKQRQSIKKELKKLALPVAR